MLFLIYNTIIKFKCCVKPCDYSKAASQSTKQSEEILKLNYAILMLLSQFSTNKWEIENLINAHKKGKINKKI